MTVPAEVDPKEQQKAVERRVERRRLQWLWTLLRNDERRHQTLFAAGLLTLGIVGVMGYFTYRMTALPFDLNITMRLQSLRYGPFRDFMYLVSLPGYSPWNVWAVLGGTLLVALRFGWKDGAFLALVTALQGLSNHLIKTAIGRPRPTQDLVEVLLPNSGNSFPSGHVMLYTVFFGFLFFLAWSRLARTPWRWLALFATGLMVVLVGPSRIVLGAHWFSDVVAAHLIALIILLFSIEFYIIYIAPSRREVAEKAVPRQSTGEQQATG